MKCLSQSLLFFLFATASLLVLASCDSESTGANRTLEVRADGVDELLGHEPGSRLHLEKEDRDALLVLLKGVWPSNRPLRFELARVVDADVFVPQREYEGDPHWISRAQVLSESGEVLWSQRINTLFQLLQFLNVILEDQSAVNLTVRQVAGLVETLYPELLEFAVKVPTGIPGGHTYRIELAEEPGAWQEVFSAKIDELVAQAEPSTIQAEVEDLVVTGPDEDRLTIVILGDGYRESERGRFEAHAQAVASRFLEASPMREHADLFNIRAIWTPSNDSGAGYDCNFQGAPPNCRQGFRDTFFDTAFVIPALMDRFNLQLGDVSDRVAMPIQIGKVFETAALGSYDDIVLISNSGKRAGFAGLYISLVTAFDSGTNFPDVAVHELGHSLGLLGDEYTVPGDSCYYNEPTIPLPANIGIIEEESVKWMDWLLENTPIPTPANLALEHPVGAYQGAYNCDFLVRPSHRCKMNSSRDDFCPVCAEQMVRRFYAFVAPPVNEGLDILRFSNELLRIRVPLRDEERYEVRWLIGGEEFHQGSTYSFGAAQLTRFESDQWVPVEVVVRNKTDFIRTPDNAIESTYRFEVRLRD